MNLRIYNHSNLTFILPVIIIILIIASNTIAQQTDKYTISFDYARGVLY